MNCKHCDDSFESEAELHRHWLNDHDDELTGHDRDAAKRTVNKLEQKQQEKKTQKRSMYRTIGYAIVAIVALAGVGYGTVQTGIVSFNADSTSSSTFTGAMTAPGTAHYHVPFEMIVDGERIDFSKPRYQVVDRRAHFEGGDGATLHMHANGVSLEYVINSFGWSLSTDSAAVKGTTYDAVSVTVNGEEIENVTDYVPSEGRPVRITLSNGETDT